MKTMTANLGDLPYKSIPVICGPTASGKSDLAMEICRVTRGELMSLDSMQIYKGMDIGTAKQPEKDRVEIPHHLIDILDPSEEYNVSVFQQEALREIESILERKNLPVLCGGTGQYVQSLTLGLQYIETPEDPELHKKLEKEMTQSGAEAMHNRLRQIDPTSAEAIHPMNKRRVLRALEIYELTEIPMSRHRELSRLQGPRYPYISFFIQRDREDLYRRIDLRVDKMMADGLLTEVEGLLKRIGGLSKTAGQGIGYKELVAYLNGSISLDEAIGLIKQRSKNYAKRQITWFSHMDGIVPITPDGLPEVLSRIKK